MNYLKFTQYIYLIFAAIFVYDGVSKMNDGENPWLSFIIAAVAVLMFFFRRYFGRRFEERSRNNGRKP